MVDSSLKKCSTTVIVPGNDSSITHPMCLGCGFYQSSWLPCECIGSVFARKDKKFKDIRNLHPYWHLSNHPLWAAAHQVLGVSVARKTSNDNMIATVRKEKDESFLVDNSIISSIEYPNKEHIRVARLWEKFNEVVEIAKKSKEQYKHLFGLLVQEQNELLGMNKYIDTKKPSSANEFNRCILAPITKKQKRKMDTTNYSPINAKKRKSNVSNTKQRKCSVCKKKGDINQIMIDIELDQNFVLSISL